LLLLVTTAPFLLPVAPVRLLSNGELFILESTLDLFTPSPALTGVAKLVIELLF